MGIKVIHKWNQLPKKRPVVVQRYVFHEAVTDIVVIGINIQYNLFPVLTFFI